jgi:16S rRNA (guanine527-N7)-methyltransferase
LPGIPISICRPEIRVILAESQGKKTAFLRESVRTMRLTTEVFDGRVEEMAEGRRFGVVTLRAVDKMAQACGVALARIAPAGWIVIFAMEGAEARIKDALPGIAWQRGIPTVGLDRGLILMGQRIWVGSVPCGTLP